MAKDTKTRAAAKAVAKKPAAKKPMPAAKKPVAKPVAAKTGKAPAKVVKAAAAKPAAKAPAKTPAKTPVKAPAKALPVRKSEAKPAARPAPRLLDRAPVAVRPRSSSTVRIEKAGALMKSSGVTVRSGVRPALSTAPGIRPTLRVAPSVPKPAEVPAAPARKLSKKDLAKIREVLELRREQLLAGMRRELATQRERAGTKAADEVDKASDAYDEDLTYEIATASDQELMEIRTALEKVDKGTYGECEVCGCAISLTRLKILPFATTCVACRGQEEQFRKAKEESSSLFPMGADEGEAEETEP